MNGIYALKPRFSEALTGVRRSCISLGVTPSHLTWIGVLAGVGAGISLALLTPGPLAALVVGSLLVVRLACANLDGGVARETGTSTRWGAVENEAGDRLADIALLIGLGVLTGWPVAGLLLFAATLPSWVALAVTAAGCTRRNGGLMGKSERCAAAVMAALTGWVLLVATAIVLGSVWTAMVRLEHGATELTGLDALSSSLSGGVR